MLPKCPDRRRAAPDATLAYDSLRWLSAVGGEKEDDDGPPELLMVRLLKEQTGSNPTPIGRHFAGTFGKLMLFGLTSPVEVSLSWSCLLCRAL